MGVACLACSAGCAADGERYGAAETRDSAGVAVVVNRASPEEVPAFTLDAPIVRIGEAFGAREVQFHRVAAGAIADGGRIIVADGGSATVRAFSPDGASQFVAGAPGDGPGEFRAMSSLSVLDDGAILVHDPAAARLTRLTPAGGLVDVRPVPPLPSGGFQYLHALPDGSALGVRFEIEIRDQEPLVAGTHRSPALLVLLDDSLQASDTLLSFPGQERHYYPKDGYDRARYTVPLMAARAVFAFHGRCAYVVLGREVSIGEVCAPAASLVRRIEWPAARLALSRDEFAERAVATVERRTGLEVTAGEVLDRYPMAVPAALPAAGGLVVGSGGYLWLADYFEGDAAASSWWVFDAAGTLRARVHLPRVHRILDIRDGRLLAVERDDLDVERIAVYRLPRGLTTPS